MDLQLNLNSFKFEMISCLASRQPVDGIADCYEKSLKSCNGGAQFLQTRLEEFGNTHPAHSGRERRFRL